MIRYLSASIVSVLVFFLVQQIYAQGSISNSNYHLQQENVNIISGGTKTNDQTVQPENQNLPPHASNDSQPYTDQKSELPFIFSISDDTIDFGSLVPGEPISRTATLGISTGSSNGYQIMTYEDHPLRNSSGGIIPDTTCDNGTCSESLAAPWSSLLTYGFGYRCDDSIGANCLLDFLNQSYYKHFPNQELGQTPQSVMYGDKAKEEASAELTYKINISSNQANGIYQNTTTYLAVPNY